MPTLCQTDLPILESRLTRGHKKRERTRQGLVAAALRLFARKEVGEIALLEIAQEAEVSHGTIYNYFRTRDEMVEAVGITLAAEFSGSISALSNGIESGAHRLAIGMRVFVLRAISDPDWARALIRIFHFDHTMRFQLAMRVRNDLRDGLQEGVLDYDEEDIALDFVMSSATGAMRAAVEGRTVHNHDVLVAEMILKALGASAACAKQIAGQPLPYPRQA